MEKQAHAHEPDPEPEPESESKECPEGMVALGDGTCSLEEDFAKEQESLDKKAIFEIRNAVNAQETAEAQEHLIQYQSRQIEKAEEDLDEIIKDLKTRKAKKERK